MKPEHRAESAPPKRRGFLLAEAVLTTKICRCCGEEKSLDLFSRRYGQPTRLCRACDAKRCRERHAKKGAEINAAKRAKRASDPEYFRAQRRNSRQRNLESERASNYKAVVRYGTAHPERVKAGRLARAAEKRGEIKRPATCEVLDCTRADLHRHHPDYSRPLDVIFVCRKHHEEIHHYRPLPLRSGSSHKFAFAPH